MVLDGCVLLGCCVIIPAAGQDIVLTQLCETHVEITKLKIIACSYVWCPCIDSDIQHKVQGCFTYQSNHPVPAKAPLHFWDIDHAGPFLEKFFFILSNAYQSDSKL